MFFVSPSQLLLKHVKYLLESLLVFCALPFYRSLSPRMFYNLMRRLGYKGEMDEGSEGGYVVYCSCLPYPDGPLLPVSLYFYRTSSLSEGNHRGITEEKHAQKGHIVKRDKKNMILKHNGKRRQSQRPLPPEYPIFPDPLPEKNTT